MRDGLAGMAGSRQEFCAEFVRYGRSHALGKGASRRTALLRDITCGAQQVADHLWVRSIEPLVQAGCRSGCQVRFSAVPRLYNRCQHSQTEALMRSGEAPTLPDEEDYCLVEIEAVVIQE